jgi:hypothetical protein
VYPDLIHELGQLPPLGNISKDLVISWLASPYSKLHHLGLILYSSLHFSLFRNNCCNSENAQFPSTSGPWAN